MTLIDMPRSGSIYRGAILGLARRRTATTLPDAEFQVADVGIDPAALAAYERVCGFPPSGVLPATYPHVLAFPIAMHLMNSPAFPFGVIGIVHIANTITQVRPIDAAERITFTVAASDLRLHDRGWQFDVTTIGTIDGTEVWRGVSTYLRRGPSSGPRASTEKAAVEEEPTEVWAIERAVGPAYARVSGDRNPIHTSWLGAKAFGFARPIAHGMWSAARCLAAIDDRPEAYTYAVGFKRPILLPSSVAFTHRGPDLALTSATSGAPHLTGTLL
jgi:hypothetical protein